MNLQTRFTVDDAQLAHGLWGANCGPGAVAAIMGMTLDEVRPHFAAVGFEQKHYTNPTMMFDILGRLARPWKKADPVWPRCGLVRIQWEGPWTKPGVPIRARYRHTHWVGCCIGRTVGIFDINCINNGSGWTDFKSWHTIAVPWILKECVPRADGLYHITHAIEVSA